MSQESNIKGAKLPICEISTAEYQSVVFNYSCIHPYGLALLRTDKFRGLIARTQISKTNITNSSCPNPF